MGLVLSLSACQNSSRTGFSPSLDTGAEALLQQLEASGGTRQYLLPASTQYDQLPQDPRNPITSEKVALGELLFHETGLAFHSKNEANGSWSCATCHFAKAGFQDKRVQSLADGGEGDDEWRKIMAHARPEDLDAPFIRSPTILNLAYQENMLWNGMAGSGEDNLKHRDKWAKGKPHGFNFLGYQGAETQAVIALGVHRQSHEGLDYETVHDAVPALEKHPVYSKMFAEAFPKQPPSRETIALAIAAYERTVVAEEAPFQRFLRGDFQALSTQEIQGAQLFFGKANCSSCHSGPALNSMSFHSVGLHDMRVEFGEGPDEAARQGRGGFTGREQDMYKFKTPQLYNLVDVGSLGHGGSFVSDEQSTALEKMLRYKLRGQAENQEIPEAQLASEFVAMQKVDFSESEIQSLLAFLENGLRDPNLYRFQPHSLPSGQRVINDRLSISLLAVTP